MRNVAAGFWRRPFMGDGTFSPLSLVDRRQVVTFLYKNARTFTVDFGVFPDIAGESGTTYENLFEVILSEDRYQTWFDCIAAVVGAENAAAAVTGLQGSISSELYG